MGMGWDEKGDMAEVKRRAPTHSLDAITPTTEGERVMDTETSRVAKLLADQAEEIVKLKQQNAELVEELWGIALHSGSREANEMARAAIAKVTGGE
jgi:hypothetical protein